MSTLSRFVIICVMVIVCHVTDVGVGKVRAQQLKPLPHGLNKRVHFYGLTDTDVLRVRPAIDALVPQRSVTLHFIVNNSNTVYFSCLLTTVVIL